MPEQILDVVGIANVWIGAGGSRLTDSLISVCEIALAESGGDVGAISPSQDYGLWQINIIHFGDGIINSGNWSDPTVNAREAIRLSNNGQNWAAWCTAWVNPAGNCGHGYLHDPQVGSPAQLRATAVINALNGAHLVGGTGRAPVLGGGGGQAELGAAWSQITAYASRGGPQQWRTLDGVRRAINTQGHRRV